MTTVTTLLITWASSIGLAGAPAPVIPSAQKAPAAAGDTLDPAGLWLTENRRAVVRIEYCDEELCGFIHWLPEDAPDFDIENPDEGLRSRPLCGLRLLWEFTPNPDRPDEWEDGQLYAADDGNTYSGRIRIEGPDRLELRGYRGIPLFGRSQEWTRTTAEAHPACTPPG